MENEQASDTRMTQHAETAPQEAEQHSISTSLDPVIERDELEPLVAQWNDQRLGSRVREKAKTDVETTIIRELRERFDLVEGAIQHLRKRGPRENRGVAKLAAFSLEEHWFQYMRMELQQNDSHDGIAFTPSPETDRSPAAAASRYFVQQASEELWIAALIHDDEELQREAVMSGDGIQGTCIGVRDESESHAIRAVWTIKAKDVAPLRIREGSTLCSVGSPKRELRVLSIERLKGDALKVELAVVSALREYRDQNGRVHPVVSAGLKGSQCGRFRASHASRGLAVGHTRTMAAA